ncbi:COX15/CtaA family protein [Microbulbifer thermotolerans]|uniref:COX15/CtaA family protein n=1 Tax=Microbulbifer thermotolerans TaxID=252514 RepID=A0AB35HXZ1_MICTH|nr:COX15/CtaA family protein [Microbulbifer thermotolerans]MCX2778464.1 COX15/CtaA family protein [Microbulbifer thermotolerans]MCX2783935.1 COX15/CtaA family protein [Microbulbifer thermotolerans]MCX2793948.1 COX15/CtaA family protein [Microbulbifer thermotolerans]MCX2801652.1 COX15/CtaA family protein [Microbulbifer thermotolerans]MCX2804027.1 COX15/CtaA family protein [Microbulbifer thermotolerans]
MNSYTALSADGQPHTDWRLRLTLIGCALALVVVVLGAFTRLMDAGLGCPDWPGCYGHLTWPVEQHEIESANAAFPHAPVETDKTWPEMVHRYFAGALLLLVAGLTALTWRRRGQRAFIQIHILLALIILQAAFGMWTVTLKLWPQVVTAHLLGGMATLSMLWLIAERLRNSPPNKGRFIPTHEFRALQKIRPLAFAAVVAVVLQIALGGWTSANYAALACADFPTCHGQWWPETDFLQGFNIAQQIGPNYLGGALESDARTAIHLTHRIGALVVTMLVLTLAVLAWRAGSRRWAIGLAVVLCLQVCLGIANVLLSLPLPIAVAHNACAAVLLLGLLTFAYRIQTAQPAASGTMTSRAVSPGDDSVLVTDL